MLLEASRLRQLYFRTYRVEKHYAVSNGKWYFEFEVLTAGPMRVGWAKADCMPGSMLGSDENTWAFDGYNVGHFKLTRAYQLIMTEILQVVFKDVEAVQSG